MDKGKKKWIGVICLTVGLILLYVGMVNTASSVGVIPATMDWEVTMAIPNPAPNQLFVIVGVIGLTLSILGIVLLMSASIPNIKITIEDED